MRGIIAALKLSPGELKESALQKSSWILDQVNGLPLLFSPLLSGQKSLVHAFTTRLGGASVSPLDSFNLGRHWTDEEAKADAMVNRQTLCRRLAVDFDRLVVPGQVHSTEIALVDGPAPLGPVDAVTTVAADTPILLHYADCVPIILFTAEIPAICVIHAGWRGTAGGIARKAVLELCRATGAACHSILAAVGPAIGPCCYPVDSDVEQRLAASVADASGLILRAGNQAAPDLKAINAMQLLESGVGAVDVCLYCTACRPDLFYSHRQQCGKTGRQGALASLRRP